MPHTTSDAVEIIHDWLKKDPELAAMVEEERRLFQLSSKIREMRQAEGITQAELANRIKSRQSVIARLESGDYDRVTMTTLIRISTALNHRLEMSFVRNGKKTLRAGRSRVRTHA